MFPVRLAGRSRVERWRGRLGGTYLLTGPFVCRCLTSAAMPRFHLPLIEPDVQIWLPISHCLLRIPARTAEADSSHELDEMNPLVIHLIDGVWQRCDDSPVGPSCPTPVMMPPRPTHWAGQLAKKLFPSQPKSGGQVAKWSGRPPEQFTSH